MTTLDALPHWHDEPDVYDALFLAGWRIPGIVKVEVSRKVKIDKKSAKGKHKAVITKQGVEAAEVTIEIRVLDPEDVAQLQERMDILEPVQDADKATADDALDIAHWVTTWRQITAIVVEETKGPELVDGVLVLTIKAIEFDKPKPAPVGQGGGGGLFIGTFSRLDGSLVQNSLVCLQDGVATVDVNGQPIKEKGTFHYWKMLAFADTSGAIVDQARSMPGEAQRPRTRLGVAQAEDSSPVLSSFLAASSL